MHCLQIPEFNSGAQYWVENDYLEFLLRTLSPLYGQSDEIQLGLERLFHQSTSTYLIDTYENLSYYVQKSLMMRKFYDEIIYIVCTELYRRSYRGQVHRVLRETITQYGYGGTDNKGHLCMY